MPATPMHHHQVTSRFVTDTRDSGDGKRRGYKPSEEQERGIARRDTDGGTAYCDVCKLRYGAKHVKRVKIAPLSPVIQICKFCQEICKFDVVD